MKISRSSLEWALEHLRKENDTDLFPQPLEIEILYHQKDFLLSKLENIDIGSYEWHSYRRFMIPKGELSYRIVTQLHPIDSLMLSSIIYEFGPQIENKRVPIRDGKVFSYRFAPEADGTLYSRSDSWKEFWTANLEKARQYEYVACLDISDFYNQIYHHTIENMMIYLGFPNEIKTAIMRLLEHITQKMSRGIPVGPHAAHLLAEMSLIPVDESLTVRGIDYCRYADDIIVFAKSEIDARTKVYSIADLLDKNQRLMLQRQKTHIFAREEFIEYSKQMLVDNPMDIQETEMLEIINRHSNDNPYIKVPPGSLTEEEILAFSQERVEDLIRKYIAPQYPDYPRLRWFFRRLTQIGVPSAVDYCIQNMDQLIPAISDVCQYLIVAAEGYEGDWRNIGEKAIALMESELFKSNEFFQITLLNLFVKNTKMDHFPLLLKMYPTASENIRRKILLCAYKNNADSFIREQKEQYSAMSDWTKWAYLISTSTLVSEERRFFLGNISKQFAKIDYLEQTIVNWSRQQ